MNLKLGKFFLTNGNTFGVKAERAVAQKAQFKNI
jgi:hypothetical protein